MRKISTNILFLIVATIIYFFLFYFLCYLFGDSLHYINRKIGVNSMYLIGIGGLDFIPFVFFSESLFFVITIKYLIHKIKDNSLQKIVKKIHYYYIVILIYSIYFVIISYLEFYEITLVRLPLSLYSF
jgi:hypothetical protein